MSPKPRPIYAALAIAASLAAPGVIAAAPCTVGAGAAAPRLPAVKAARAAYSPAVKAKYAKLSDEELEGIRIYTDIAGYFEQMNGLLRGQNGGPTCANQQRWIAVTSSGLAKVKVPDNEKKLVAASPVARGVSWRPEYVPVFRDSLKVGQTFTEKAFMSTAIGQSTWEANPDTGAGAKVLYLIFDKAKRGVPVWDISIGHRLEQEVLFAPGTKLKVTKIQLRQRKEDRSLGEPVPVPDPVKQFPDADEGARAFNNSKLYWEISMETL